MQSRVALVLCLLGWAASAWAGEKPFPGLEMATYTAPDKSFSMLYPKGWTASPQEAGITFAENAADDTSAHIDVFILQFGEASLTGEQIIGMLAGQMKQQYPGFSIKQQQQLSQKPDIRGVLFAYTDGGVPVSGFGLVMSAGKAAIWSDIYGKDAGFTGYNPVVVLSYVMQSLAQGPAPNKPKMQPPARAARAPQAPADAATKKKMDEAAVMTHFWNNAPSIVPDAFSTYVPPLF